MEFTINENVKLIEGLNTYKVVGLDGDYAKLLCIEFKQPESITFDQMIFSYNFEFYIKISESKHLFEGVK